MIISEKIYWILSYVAVALTAGMILFHWNELPEQVAMHFNAQGAPDRFGAKSELFILPVISGLLILLMRWMSGNKSIMKINPHKMGARTPRELNLSRRMISQIALYCSILLGYTTYLSMAVSVGKQQGLGSSFILFTIGGLLLIMMYYLWQLFRLQESKD